MEHKIKDTQYWYTSSIITKTGSGVHNNWPEHKFLVHLFMARYVSFREKDSFILLNRKDIYIDKKYHLHKTLQM